MWSRACLVLLKEHELLFAFFVFLWNVTEIKANLVKVREKQKLELASFFFSVFPCAGETEVERGQLTGGQKSIPEA